MSTWPDIGLNIDASLPNPKKTLDRPTTPASPFPPPPSLTGPVFSEWRWRLWRRWRGWRWWRRWRWCHSDNCRQTETEIHFSDGGATRKCEPNQRNVLVLWNQNLVMESRSSETAAVFSHTGCFQCVCCAFWRQIDRKCSSFLHYSVWWGGTKEEEDLERCVANLSLLPSAAVLVPISPCWGHLVTSLSPPPPSTLHRWLRHMATRRLAS